jgi:predicted ferric reductase
MAMKKLSIWTVTGVGLLIVGLALPWGSVSDAGPTLPWIIYLQLLFATGFLALALMSVAMVLALRLPRIESWVGGLDQCYRLHRLSAEWGVGLGLTHYLVKVGAKALRKEGLLVKPQGFDSGIPELFSTWHDVAKLLGELGLYASLALVAVALIRAIPYHLFARLHRILPLLYLGFVLHGVVFLPLSYWKNLSGAVFVICVVAGLVATGLSLSGRIGRNRQVQGRVAEVTSLGKGVQEVQIDLGPAWPGHQAGQFALFTFDTREGAHPFTIASAWEGENARQRRIRVAIKALGDYTSTLPDTLAAEAPVRVEGPYGSFSFDQGKGRQIWIAGGIGLTPFVARLEHLVASTAEHEPVDLFYSARRVSPETLARLSAIASAGAVRLHVIDTEQEAPLNAKQVVEMIPDWKASSIWFCGPLKFGDALEKSFVSMGLPKGQFHREAFDFR